MNNILKSVSTSKQGPGEQLKYIGAVQEWPRTGWRAEPSKSGKVAKCMKAGKRGKAGKRESTGTGRKSRHIWGTVAEPCSCRSCAPVRLIRSTLLFRSS